MSTLATYNLKHPDAAGDQITFASDGNVGIHTASPGDVGFTRALTIDTGTGNGGFEVSQDGTCRAVLATEANGDVRFGANGSTLLKLQTGQTNRLVIDTNGRILAGGITSASEDSVAFQLKTQYNASGNNQKLSLLHTQFSATTSSVIEFNRSRDNFGGDSAVIDDSQLGAIVFRGYDGTQYSEGAGIKAFVDANPGNGDMPGRLEFATSNDGEATLRTRLTINGSGRMSGQARYIERVFNLLYARLQAHGGCSSGGPSGTFTDFDGSEPAFITVPRTTTTATSGYSFIGDGAGNAFSLFVGCGDNPVFGTHSKDSDAPEFRSWVLVDNQFVSALGGAPTNATRASLPTTP